MKFLSTLLLSIITFMAVYAGETRHYEMKVGLFDKVKVLDNVNVVYRNLPDSIGYVQYYGDEEFDDAFILRVTDNGTLKIQVSSEDVGAPDLPTLFIYSDFLTGVENSSNFNMTIESVAPCPEFRVTQVGNGSIVVERIRATKVWATINTGKGSITLGGESDAASFKMVGAGLIAADRLKTNNVTCTIVGTGSIACWAVENLSLKGVGTTKVYYKGNPQIKKSGGGKLFELP